jgi:hypothetical protein
MMFSRFCTKAVPCLLIVTLLIPSGLLFYPKKVQAGNDCLLRIGAALGINKALNKLAATKVPIEETSQVQAGIGGSFISDCVIKPLVTQLAKEMLRNITVSTINWINSGFKGNPGFVTNFRGLLVDAADQVIGNYLEKEAGFLCAPFAFQIRVQLAETFLPERQRARCTLTQAVQNATNFANNNGGVGWDNWLEVTTQPQNNQYGAFVIAQDDLSKKIVDAQYVAEKKLGWASGFKDWVGCDDYDEYGEPLCDSFTPGKIVQDRLSETLHVDLKQLEVADNLNAIFDALANQFTKQLVGGVTGLLGSKKGAKTSYASSYGSVNYDEAIKVKNTDTKLGDAIDDSLGETGDDLTPFFTEPEVIDPNDTPADDGEDEPVPPEVQTIELSILHPQNVTVENNFPYEVDLISNFSSSGYKVTMNFLKQDVRTGVYQPVRISDVFASPQEVTFGRTDLYISTQSINFGPNSSIPWGPISTSKGFKYIFKFNGKKKDSSLKGTYTIETTLKDSSDKLLDTKRSNFIIP